MKNEDLNMDKIFREKLNVHSVEPPAHLWDGIREQVIAAKRKKRIAYISRIAAAAVVILAFLGGWYLNEKSDNVVHQTTQVSKTEEKPANEESSAALDLQSKVKKDAEIDKSLDAVKRKQESKSDPKLIVEAQMDLEEEAASNSLKMREYIKFDHIDKFKAKLTINNFSTQSLQKITGKESKISNDESVLIANNITSTKISNEKETGWKMGVNVAPGYSSYASNYSNSYVQNMTYTGSEGEGNISGGISVQYKTRGRWSIESGISYAKSTQASINTPQLVAYSNADDFYGFSPNAGERYYFNTALKVADNKAIMNSGAGVIEFDELPADAELAANMDVASLNETALLTAGEFSQVFDFVEIPLYLRYLILDSGFDIELIGGLNAGLVVGNNAFIKNSGGIQNVGRTQNISSFNISGTFGVGVNYDLGKHISLAVEPRLNYYLNSINHNPEVEYRPYRIGIYTGLYYAF